VKKQLIGTVLALALSFTASAVTIDKLVVNGNNKVSRDTILFYMKSREKGIYSESLLKEDFKSLWRTGFFENITIESFDSEKIDAKVVKIILEENPLIASVTFKTGKKISEKDITEQLQENSIILTEFSYYNPAKIKRAEKIIKDMLVEKGYNQGTAQIIVKNAAEQQVALTVQVNNGPKTRIGAIEFPGLKGSGISADFLRRGMKHNKPHSLLSLIGGKDVFSKEKIKEDLEAVKNRLMERGYLEARVSSPEVSMFKKASVLGKIQQMLRITIPVEPGSQYRVGNISIAGNKVIKTPFLQRLVKLRKGAVYDIEKRNKCRQDIQDVYGNLGYIFCQVVPVENLDPVKRVADLTLQVHEGDVAYVGKLEFNGNTYTKDYVLRREWLLQEGSRFNTGWLKACLTRLKQLGLVGIAKEPEFKPDPEDPKKMDIKVHVKELRRQSATFNFGYSGYDGLFGALGYSTHNFLGSGETLEIYFQMGTRAKQYRFSFTEPYLFNLPANMGFSIYKTSVQYPGYTLNEQGIRLTSSARLWRFLRGSLSYGYRDVKTAALDENLLLNPLYNLYFYNGKISSLSPSVYYSTVDSPLFPSSGSKALFSYTYSGGFLKGDVNLHKTRLQLAKFFPLWNRHVLGMQLVHQAVFPFGGQEFVPRFERIYLGGEQSIRGFDMYRVGPRNERGEFIGGNKAFFMNLEYMVPLNDQFTVALFYDLGNAYAAGQQISLKDVYSSMGLEMRVFVPMLNVPFRLIFAYNPRTLEAGNNNFTFRFAVGTSFN
jgi:outer membrane protein insertion porin family